VIKMAAYGIPTDCNGPVVLTTIIAFTIFAAEDFTNSVRRNPKNYQLKHLLIALIGRRRVNGQINIRNNRYKRTRNSNIAHVAYRSPSLERAFAPAQDFASWPFHSSRGHA